MWDVGHEDAHEVHRRIRKLAEEYERGIVTIGEIHEFDPKKWISYYGSDDELNMPFNYQLMVADWTAKGVREAIETVESVVPEWGWINWTMGNHDEIRVASRLGDLGARQAAVLLATLRGTPFMYYGDELGMLNGMNQGRDPWGDNVSFLSRDGCRTPMQWDSSEGVGFTDGEPWIPIGPDHDRRNVENEKDDPESFLSLYRRRLALRRSRPSLRSGSIRCIDAPPDVLLYERREGLEATTVGLNFSADPVQVHQPGDLLFATGEHEEHPGSAMLGPHSAVVWDTSDILERT